MNDDDMSQPMRTELFAASLRADKTGLKPFLDALAIKLEGSSWPHAWVP